MMSASVARMVKGNELAKKMLASAVEDWAGTAPANFDESTIVTPDSMAYRVLCGSAGGIVVTHCLGREDRAS